MSAIIPPTPKPRILYPDSDGEPMSDNTVQFRWIVTMHTNLEDLFHNDPNVFVAGDHLIYPVEGDAKTRQAPDVYVAFGRPKGDRGSYKVFEEGGIFPQVVIEVWSPNNRMAKMLAKLRFYEKYGAEEYFILYPEFPAHVDVWRREGGQLVQVEDFENWVSPRLGVRFGVDQGELVVRGPDGRLFRSAAQIAAEREAERQRADAEAQRAESEKRRADAEAQHATAEKLRAERLAAKLRELGVDPDAV